MRPFIATIILVLFANQAYSYEQVVRFSEDPWPPYTIGEEGQVPSSGLAVTLVNTIFEELHVETELRLYPWKRCLLQMERGERDALMLLGYSEEREAYLQYTVPVIDVRDLVWFRKSDVKQWQTLEDFKGLKFGRTSGFQYGHDFEEASKSGLFSVEEAPTDRHNFSKLLYGRIDAFIANEITAADLFKKTPEFKNQFTSAEKPLKNGPLYMGFSKKSEAVSLVPKVNAIIERLKAEGKISEIFLGTSAQN